MKISPCKPQFYYIKVGCKGVFITQTRLYDEILLHPVEDVTHILPKLGTVIL